MDDDCTECNIQNLQLSNFPNCTTKSIKKFCKKIPECENIKDLEFLLKKNDTIFYITVYLATCWFILQTFRKDFHS